MSVVIALHNRIMVWGRSREWRTRHRTQMHLLPRLPVYHWQSQCSNAMVDAVSQVWILLLWSPSFVIFPLLPFHLLPFLSLLCFSFCCKFSFYFSSHSLLFLSAFLTHSVVQDLTYKHSVFTSACWPACTWKTVFVRENNLIVLLHPWSPDRVSRGTKAS